MLDLDESARLRVARAPQRHELRARLQRPLRRSDDVRHAHGERLVVEIEHVELQLRGDFFAEAILRFQHRAIRPCRELEWQRRLPCAVGLESSLRRDFAKFPRIRVSRNNLRLLRHERLCPAPRPAAALGEIRAHDLRGLLELVNFHHTLRRLPLAIVGLRENRHIHRLRRRLPFVRR